MSAGYRKRPSSNTTYTSLMQGAKKQRAGSAAARAARGPFNPASLAGRNYGAPILGRSNIKEVKSWDCVMPALGTVTLPAWNAPPTFSEPSLAVAWSGGIELNAIMQGASFFQRIGTKIVVKSISVSFSVFGHPGTNPPTAVRSVLLYDRQPNKAFPTFDAIFQNNDGSVGYPTQFTCGLNMSNRSRFSMIRDQYDIIDPASGLQHLVKLFCKGRWECEYSTNTGLIGDLNTGAIYLIVFADQVAAADNGGYISDLTARLRYFD